MISQDVACGGAGGTAGVGAGAGAGVKAGATAVAGDAGGVGVGADDEVMMLMVLLTVGGTGEIGVGVQILMSFRTAGAGTGAEAGGVGFLTCFTDVATGGWGSGGVPLGSSVVSDQKARRPTTKARTSISAATATHRFRVMADSLSPVMANPPSPALRDSTTRLGKHRD